MNTSTKLVTIIGLALTSAAVAVGGLDVASASSASKAHTLTFDSVQTSQKANGSSFADADTDKAKGKVLGYDVVNGRFHAKSKSITVDVAASLKGGILDIHGTGTSQPNRFSGTITGGTGRFKSVKGTVSGEAYGKHDDNEHLSVTYH